MKLKWTARQKMTPQDKLSAKQLKETAKLEAALKKSKEKLESKAQKAKRKVQEQEAKAKEKEKVAAQQLKQAHKLEALKQKEKKKEANELLKQDNMYNRWLVDVFSKFKFDMLKKKGLDPTTNPNYMHYEKYMDIYYGRYPDRLKTIEKVAESLKYSKCSVGWYFQLGFTSAARRVTRMHFAFCVQDDNEFPNPVDSFKREVRYHIGPGHIR
ncbi:hypothetical protein F441_04176 [Phytophthora nicotianae CJ01A1]|uniref:Uncharacterized protein n=1 Tax=Phytophthora nicotianae CJ01A1 TaxID=1317063 RepID=W2XI01_PHYNI|nr:hypothetical protein F441_04176 [Phytophthora nicotianae CJ01A1]